MEAHRSDAAARGKDERQGVELSISGKAAKEPRLPWRGGGPKSPFGPVEHDGTVADARKDVLLDVRLPVRALGVNEEDLPSVSGVRPPEPDAKNGAPDEEPSEVTRDPYKDKRQEQGDKRQNPDRLETIHFRAAV